MHRVFFDVTASYLHLCATWLYIVVVGFFSAGACVEARSTRKSKTRNTAAREETIVGGSGRDRAEGEQKMVKKRRKREAPNTQHNPAASSASMDFKRSPRLLLLPFLSFSFFYYYFRGKRRGENGRERARAPERGSMRSTTCVPLYVCICVHAYTCLCTCLLVPG